MYVFRSMAEIGHAFTGFEGANISGATQKKRKFVPGCKEFIKAGEMLSSGSWLVASRIATRSRQEFFLHMTEIVKVKEVSLLQSTDSSLFFCTVVWRMITGDQVMQYSGKNGGEILCSTFEKHSARFSTENLYYGFLKIFYKLTFYLSYRESPNKRENILNFIEITFFTCSY